jgi:hypothetical protein
MCVCPGAADSQTQGRHTGLPLRGCIIFSKTIKVMEYQTSR